MIWSKKVIYQFPKHSILFWVRSKNSFQNPMARFPLSTSLCWLYPQTPYCLKVIPIAIAPSCSQVHRLQVRDLTDYTCSCCSESCSVMTNSSQPHGLYSPWHSLGQEPGGGSLSFLQEIFPHQGLNPGLPHCRQILYQLSHKRNWRILQWVAYPFSSGSSQPRNWTRVSYLTGRFFTNLAIREAPMQPSLLSKSSF